MWVVFVHRAAVQVDGAVIDDVAVAVAKERLTVVGINIDGAGGVVHDGAAV